MVQQNWTEETGGPPVPALDAPVNSTVPTSSSGVVNALGALSGGHISSDSGGSRSRRRSRGGSATATATAAAATAAMAAVVAGQPRPGTLAAVLGRQRGTVAAGKSHSAATRHLSASAVPVPVAPVTLGAGWSAEVQRQEVRHHHYHEQQQQQQHFCAQPVSTDVEPKPLPVWQHSSSSHHDGTAGGSSSAPQPAVGSPVDTDARQAAVVAAVPLMLLQRLHGFVPPGTQSHAGARNTAQHSLVLALSKQQQQIPRRPQAPLHSVRSWSAAECFACLQSPPTQQQRQWQWHPQHRLALPMPAPRRVAGAAPLAYLTASRSQLFCFHPRSRCMIMRLRALAGAATLAAAGLSARQRRGCWLHGGSAAAAYGTTNRLLV